MRQEQAASDYCYSFAIPLVSHSECLFAILGDLRADVDDCKRAVQSRMQLYFAPLCQSAFELSMSRPCKGG
ncbi:hypothetical protein [Paraburkholderia elongata]|uniref:Uncharacterized protein n=1 Tax=Paraburkholderia elongata TaxID=2675747 RepID=A0A972NPE5_9BURK|nr:hypothetical protein [Paraburkholderia elongata]NPT56611.1 hypothetical protein [Paraburkholderia elongata]